jgi:hypothetical protein
MIMSLSELKQSCTLQQLDSGCAVYMVSMLVEIFETSTP